MLFLREVKEKVQNSSLVKDSFWALFGNAFGKGLTVLSGIFVARFLGKDLYGEFGLLRNTIIIIAVFSTMGLGYSGTVFLSEKKAKNEGGIGFLSSLIQYITILFSSVIALLVFIFSKQIAIFLEDPSLFSSIRILSVVVVFNALTTTQISILAGLKEFKRTARVNVYSGIVNFILTCLFTWFWGFNGAVFALLLSQIFNCILNSLLLSRIIARYDNPYNRDYSIVKPLLSFSIPIALQEMTISVAHWAISVFLLKLTNYGEIGLYSAGGQWIAILQFLPIALRNVTLSHMSGASTDQTRGNILKRMILLNAMVTLVPTVLICAFNGVIDSIYGPSFEKVGLVVTLACIAASINSVFSVFASDFMAKKQNWKLFSINIFRELIKFPLLFCLIMYCNISGAFGAYYSIIITECLAVLFCLFFEVKSQKDNSLFK